MKDNKRIIRKSILDARNRLTDDEIMRNSLIIAERMFGLEEFRKSHLIMCFMSFGSEVRTDSLIERSMALGKRIAVPMVVKDCDRHGEIIACEVKNPCAELEKGTYGILEPKKDCIRCVSPESIDFVVVPGIAFDVRRNRLGYGAGYYDGFLKKVRKDCVKVGIAFDFQVLEKIPAEEHDIPVDMIVTEKKIYD